MTDESKRRHVSSACQPCRGSKIKCDGARPSCANCSRKEKECHYAAKDDKRRVSLRSAVDILSGRVSVLSQALMQHGITLPAMDPVLEETLKNICETLNIALPPLQDRDSEPGLNTSDATNVSLVATNWQETDHTIPQTLQEPVFQTTEIPIVGQEPVERQDCLSTSDGCPTDGSMTDWPWHMLESDPFSMSGPLDFGSLDSHSFFMPGDAAPIMGSKSVLNGVSGVTSGVSSDEEPESDLVQEVSARFGALRMASDGQLRYYGAATNYHLLEGSRHDEDVEMFTTKQEMLDRLEQAGLNQDVPTDLEEHLIELYFTWHNPSHINVDRETFLAARGSGPGTALNAGYASVVLLNAICAIGAAYESRYHPVFVTYPRSLADYFASRAKILLEAELDCPTIATVQGLCLLSSHEAARSRDARTWLYGGMAMRLCFDLGLHIDCSSYVKAGLLSLSDARTRQSTFWSCVVLNHLSSFHFGRPFRIDSEEITVRPLFQAANDTIANGQTLDDDDIGLQQSQIETLKAWVFLCETMVPLMRKLYGSSSIPLTTLQEVSSSVTHRLEEWWTNLPTSMRVGGGRKSSPGTILLHMTYHHFQILIHRPWTSYRSQPWTGQGPGFRHARRICSTSASNISQLLIQYEKDYSFGRMHSYAVNVIFSAALISLFNVIATKGRLLADTTPSEATANLSIFFRALDDLSRSFDSAKRAREHLATIQRKWYLSGLQSGQNSKRVQQSAQLFIDLTPKIDSALKWKAAQARYS